jgi:hypothetical protein
MAAIEAIMFAGAAGFAVIIVSTVLVIIGVRQEQKILDLEGRQTFAHRDPPTALALLARLVLGARFLEGPEELPEPEAPKEEEPPWYERPVGPRAR